MRMKLHHTPYVSRRITRDLISCDFVEVRKEKHSIEAEVERILDADLEKEFTLDEKVQEILAAQEEEIEYLNADRRQLFYHSLQLYYKLLFHDSKLLIYVHKPLL